MDGPELNIIAPSPVKPTATFALDATTQSVQKPLFDVGAVAGQSNASPLDGGAAIDAPEVLEGLNGYEKAATLNEDSEESGLNRSSGLLPRRKAAPTTFGYEKLPKRKRKSEGDAPQPPKRPKGEELNDPLTVRTPEGLLLPPKEKSRQRSNSLTSVSSVGSSLTSAASTFEMDEPVVKLTKSGAARKPSKPSKITAAPPFEPYEHFCTSDDVFIARWHVREFVVRFQQFLYPTSTITKSKTRTGKTRFTSREVDPPAWFHRSVNSLRHFWTHRDHVRGLVEGLLFVIQQEDCERDKGDEGIDAPRLKKYRNILSTRTGDKFKRFQSEMALARASPRQDWNAWMTLEEILVLEGYMEALPVPDEPDVSDSENESLSELSNLSSDSPESAASDGDNNEDEEMDELATQGSSYNSPDEDSLSEVASDVDELQSSEDEKPIKKPSSNLLAVPKQRANGSRSRSLSTLSATSKSSKTKQKSPLVLIVDRKRRNHTADEKLQIIEAFISMLVERSVTLKESINEGPNRLIQARKLFYKQRKEFVEEKTKHAAEKPSANDPAEKTKAWKAELDEKELEYNRNIAELYPALHMPTVRFETTHILGRLTYLPTPVSGHVSAPEDNETRYSSFSVLFRSKSLGPPPIKVHATKKEKEDYQKAVKAAAKDASVERWYAVSGGANLQILADWLDSESRVRVWQRRVDDWEREESGRPPKVVNEGVEAQQEAEERAARDFGVVLRQFGSFVEVVEKITDDE